MEPPGGNTVSEPTKRPDAASPSPPTETPAERRDKRRAMMIGTVVGGVIGVTLGLLILAVYRGCTAERHPPPEAPIKLLPPRPTNPTPSSSH